MSIKLVYEGKCKDCTSPDLKIEYYCASEDELGKCYMPRVVCSHEKACRDLSYRIKKEMNETKEEK